MIAEAAKLIEDTQRDLKIDMVNELLLKENSLNPSTTN